MKKINKTNKTNKIVRIYFQTVSPESAERGDFSETGEHDELKDYTVEELLRHVESTYGYLEASSSQFHVGQWYTTTDPDLDLSTGEETYYTIHLENYAEEEQRLFYSKFFGGK